MNTPAVVYPPNRPLERILSPSKVPALYNFLFFIDINSREEIIVGCSNINSAYWEGTLFHYKNYSDFLNGEHAGFYISTSSTSDAKFIKGTNYVVLAEDTGLLKILNMSLNGSPHIKCEDRFNTNARLEQLAVWDDTQRVLTCADTTVAIWDVKGSTNANLVHEFKNYHVELVTSVDVNKSQPNLFASASYDKRALIWDDRMDIPATVLYENEFSCLTSISWNPLPNEYLAVGTAGGYLYNFDWRQPKEFVQAKQCFEAPIYRIACNSADFLAVCGDVPEVLVLNNKDLDVLYISAKHLAFARGLAWHRDSLYSCGFDRKIIKHEI